MIRILFVDDMLHRLAYLRVALARAGVDAEVVHRAHVAAVDFPTDIERADVVFLDHDMCVNGEGDPCPTPVPGDWSSDYIDPPCGCPDGRDLVDRMLAHGVKRRVVIQSVNRAHGPEMLRRLMVRDWDVVYSPAASWRSVTPLSLVRRWGLVPGAVAA